MTILNVLSGLCRRSNGSNVAFKSKVKNRICYQSIGIVQAPVLSASFVVFNPAFFLAGYASAQQSAGSQAKYIQEWTQILAGNKVVKTVSESSGGYDGSSVSVAAERATHFCSNGQMIYTSKSIVSGSVPGMDFGDDGTKQEVITGRWRIADADAQKATLEVIEENGGKTPLALQIVNGRLHFNGIPSPGGRQSELCQ